jgi:hypothetical protein
MNRLLARAAASAALLLVVLLSSAAPTLASCLVLPALDEGVLAAADSVFVGTVTNVSNSDRWATVAVEEVWMGPDLPPVVEVRGGPGPGTASSIDRTYSARVSYLFVVGITDGVLSDNVCSATIGWSPELGRLRPATARQPVTPGPDPDTAAPFDPASLLLPAALIVGAGAVVFGGALVLRRRT